MTAREVAQFVYCKHSWWLSRQNAPVTEEARRRMNAGVAWQDQRDAQVPVALEYQARSRTASRRRGLVVAAAIVLLISGCRYGKRTRCCGDPAVVALVAWPCGCVIVLRPPEKRPRCRVAISSQSTASEPGGDLAGMLQSNIHSERYGISGRPDRVIRNSSGYVPVELKQARCPRYGPHPRELAQLAVYCLLIEEHLQCAVSEGILRYADREVLVRFDDRMAYGSYNSSGKCDTQRVELACRTETTITLGDAVPVRILSIVGKHFDNLLLPKRFH